MTFEDPLFQPPPYRVFSRHAERGLCLAHHDQGRWRVESAAIPL